MHSLKFNVTTDSVRNRTWPSRLSNGLGSCSGRNRCLNYNNNCLRSCRIVACAPDRYSSGKESQGLDSGHGSGTIPGTSPSSSLSRSQIYALLKQQMDVAAKSEDYKEAARLRDSLKMLEEEEPVLRLRRLLKEAIDDQRFEDAAKYHNELKEIAPHSLLKCSSDTTTLVSTCSNPVSTLIYLGIKGIRVQVRSAYIESHSQPSKGQYFFAYRIRITNNSDRPVQLLRRHWIITDANERTEHVRGTGVIGEQPVILPNTGFEYSSACPLRTSSGRMEGDFEMKHVDVARSRTFNVAIAPFSFSAVADGGDSF